MNKRIVPGKLNYSLKEDILYTRPYNRNYESSVQYGDIIVDLDNDKRVAGIEILDASKVFHINKELLRNIRYGQVETIIKSDKIAIYFMFKIKFRNAIRDIYTNYINNTLETELKPSIMKLKAV